MKFSGYQSNAQLHVATPHVTAPANPLAYGAGGAAWQAGAKALGQVGAVVEKKQEEADTQDLLDARNKIMTSLTQQMYNSENGFMTTGYGENAKGLTDRVTEAVKNTTDDILKDYNGRVQKAARKNLSENIANYQRIAASRESGEAVKMKGVRYENSLKDAAQQCGLNYNNDEIIRSQLQQGEMLTAAMGADMGLPGSSIAIRQREMYTSNIASAVNSAVQAENYDRAFNLLNTYKPQMDNVKWNEMYAKVKKGKEIRENDRIARDIAGRAYRNGHFNANIARQEIDKLYGPNGMNKPAMFDFLESKRGTPYNLGADGTDETDCGKLVQDAAEAAGYTFNSRAADMQYYQLQQEGGLVSREQAQPGDVVFWHVPGSRWTYTDNPDGDETTAYKGVTHTGILLDNGMVMQAGSSGVTEMDMDQYEIVGIGRMQGNYDPERERQINALVRAYGNDFEREYKYQKNEQLENLATQMQEAGSQAGALNLIEQADLDPKDKLKMQGMAKRMYNPNNTGTGAGTVDEYGDVVYTQKQLDSAKANFTKYLRALETDRDITSAGWNDAIKAADIIYNAGMLTQDERDDIDLFRTNENRQAMLLDNLNEGGYQQAYKDLLASKVSRTAAAIILTDIDIMYQQ